MKRGSILLIFVLSCLLCGCGGENEIKDNPEYFKGIIQKLETTHTLDFIMDEWWEKSIGAGAYEEGRYTCLIDGKTFTFDMQDNTLAEEQWWETAGIFQPSGEDRVYICLYDANLTYSQVGKTYPDRQIILIDYDMDNPGDYQIVSYSVVPAHLFSWINNCYCIGDYLYIAGQSELGAINLQTKEFYYRSNEFQYLEEYAQKEYGVDSYHIYHFNATLEQEGVIVYSAVVSVAYDDTPIGAVCVACRDGLPIAYMNVKLTAEVEVL